MLSYHYGFRIELACLKLYITYIVSGKIAAEEGILVLAIW